MFFFPLKFRNRLHQCIIAAEGRHLARSYWKFEEKKRMFCRNEQKIIIPYVLYFFFNFSPILRRFFCCNLYKEAWHPIKWERSKKYKKKNTCTYTFKSNVTIKELWDTSFVAVLKSSSLKRSVRMTYFKFCKSNRYKPRFVHKPNGFGTRNILETNCQYPVRISY